jgi:hypothetical protein
MKWHKAFFGLAIAAAVCSCTKAPKADTPEGALEKYVTTAFAANSPADRQKLADLSAGEALTFIQNMSDDDFKKYFLDSHLRFSSLKTKDKRQDVNGDVSVIYELEYKEGETAAPTVHTNKKIAYLTFDKASGEWKIRATKNLKSFVERKEDLVVTPDTTSKEEGSAAGEK